MRLVPALLLLSACDPGQHRLDPATVAAPQFAANPGREPLVHVDVREKTAEGAGRFLADWSFDLVAHGAWSAHVHVIPGGQVVPPHRHPGNDELVFVAEGSGEWLAWERDGDGAPRAVGDGATDDPPAAPLRSSTFAIAAGDAVLSPRGSVHGVRNRGPGLLATIVVQRPEFGQNWYVLADDAFGSVRSRPFGVAQALPDPLEATTVAAPEPAPFAGWTLSWATAGRDGTARAGEQAERLYMVAQGEGTIAFEEHVLPLRAGIFVKVPPGLDHRIEAGGAGLEWLEVHIPR